jgi:hypothetical protein
MRSPAVSSDPIAQQVGTYLAASAAHVVPLYTIEKQGGFSSGSPAAIDFVDARLADGAAELRDLIVAAWNESATVKVGYPDAVTPAEAEGGTIFHRNQVAPSD